MPIKTKIDTELYNIDKNGCWIFKGNLSHNGYGQMKRLGKHIRATHYFYEKYVSKIAKGLVLDHKCRIVSCVNPNHLEAVTIAENTRRGNSARLNMAIVNEIISSYNKGNSQAYLAKKYSVHQSTISRIINKLRWQK